jgi:hypothetical protein
MYRSKEQARAYWQDVLKQWEQSGLSVHRFCLDHHITESGFYTWRKKLSVAHTTESKPRDTTEPGFVQLDMHRAPQRPLALELATGHTLHIANQVNSDTLSTVIHALQEAALC